MRGARRDDGARSGSPSASRRGAGELESAVLAVLWSADGPLSPGEVRDRLGGGGEPGGPAAERAAAGDHATEGSEPGHHEEPAPDPADLSYSTVVTILSRLHDKGALSRRKDGRAFRYAPVADAAGLAARQLSALLDRQSDRQAVLARFIADLSDSDEALLRELLGPETRDDVA